MGFRQIAGFCKVGLWGMLFFACSPEGSEVDAVSSINEYFDVQGLLERNEAQLRKMDVVLQKKATFSGVVEESVVSLDSLALVEEFDVFREVDINKPVLSGRYLTEKKIVDGKEVITYEADDKEELNINYLKVYKDSESDEVERLEALFSSRNILYQSTRLVSMQYDLVKGENLPVYYQVEGSQKMIFSNKEHYVIKAEFEYAGPQ